MDISLLYNMAAVVLFIITMVAGWNNTAVRITSSFGIGLIGSHVVLVLMELP